MTTEKALDPAYSVLRNILDLFADETPDAPFVQFWPGDLWDYRTTRDNVRARAAALQAAGVAQGDHVLCFMGNGPDLLTSWFAINYLGAVYVPVNTAARGRPLEHVLQDADAVLMIAESALIHRLTDLSTGSLRRILTVDTGDLPALPSIEITPMVDDAEAASRPGALELARPIQPWDTQAIMYTSGTTGDAKGVMSSYVQLYTMGPDAFDCVEADDRCMICGPIFHCGSTLYVYAMLARGLSIGMMREFKTKDFWPAVRETGSTYALLLGVMASFLIKEPPSAQDRDHPLRRAFITPFGEDGPLFAQRFGVEAWTIYNMTEIASPMHAGPNITRKGIAGKPRPWFELRVVDENDIALPDGETGELVIRSHRPWALMKGYYKKPAATAEAMQNGWFHTGDGFRREADGTFYFVDRLKDIIRRRGENISSFALENEVVAHPCVRECAALAVPSEHSEDDVMIAVTPVDGAKIDIPDLLNFLSKQLPHYMVPRYVRVLDDLPKTANGKIQKAALRREGVTPSTYDVDKSGSDRRQA